MAACGVKFSRFRTTKASKICLACGHSAYRCCRYLSYMVLLEDRTPFEAIEQLYGLNQHQLIKLMRRELNAGSFRLWRARTSGRTTKHLALRSPEINRAYCPSQYKR